MVNAYLVKDGSDAEIRLALNFAIGKIGPLGERHYVCTGGISKGVAYGNMEAKLTLEPVEGDGCVLAVHRNDVNHFVRVDPYEDNRVDWNAFVERGWKLFQPA